MKVATCWVAAVSLLVAAPVRQTAFAEPPASLSELTEAWDDWLVEQDRPMWGILTTVWRDERGGELSYPFTKETKVRWIIDAPPSRLLKTEVREDGELNREFANGSNEDYMFQVRRSADEADFRLKAVAANEGVAAKDYQETIDGWVIPWQRRQLSFLGHKGYLSDIVREVPEAFRLEAGDNGLVLLYSREDAAPDAQLGALSDVISAEFSLDSSSPWVPNEHRMEPDPQGRSQARRVTEFSGTTMKYQTFMPDGSPIVTVTDSFEERRPGDEEMLKYTRLTAYGLPEPAVGTSSSPIWLITVVVLGAFLIGGGAYLLKRASRSW